MPVLEPKVVQKELSQGQFWPVYWLHGAESMKAREVLKRVRQALFPEGSSSLLAEQSLLGGETSAAEVLDASQSLALGGGARLTVVRDAHLLKLPEELAPLLGPRCARNELTSVTVFLSKDLDRRKKFSKMLLDSAACVPCEEVPESDREAWIGYLAKARGATLTQGLVARLLTMDPWTLDIVDNELEKFSLSGDEDLVSGQGGLKAGSEVFLEAFFQRRLKEAVEACRELAERPEESIPLLGLLGWNARHLALLLKDERDGTRTLKINPFLQDRFRRWARQWKLNEVAELQTSLSSLDFDTKQTAKISLGLWTTLVTRYCR
ncbi:MAG TPA: hypothetical protein VL588_04680 [Bdellovibrionota bacterium]|nr:hypothetical protein [Bdellovibrionota bacterium]